MITCKFFWMMTTCLSQCQNSLRKLVSVTWVARYLQNRGKNRKVDSTWIVRTKHGTMPYYLRFTSCWAWKKRESFSFFYFFYLFFLRKVVTGNEKVHDYNMKCQKLQMNPGQPTIPTPINIWRVSTAIEQGEKRGVFRTGNLESPSFRCYFVTLKNWSWDGNFFLICHLKTSTYLI